MKMNDLYTSRLRTFRKEAYYTQIELSEAIDITPEYYSALERGKKRPSMYFKNVYDAMGAGQYY